MIPHGNANIRTALLSAILKPSKSKLSVKNILIYRTTNSLVFPRLFESKHYGTILLDTVEDPEPHCESKSLCDDDLLSRQFGERNGPCFGRIRRSVVACHYSEHYWSD